MDHANAWSLDKDAIARVRRLNLNLLYALHALLHARSLTDAIAKLTRIAQGDGSYVPRREEIPDLFTAAYPVLGRRFAAQLEASNAAFSSFRREVAAWLTSAGC